MENRKKRSKSILWYVLPAVLVLLAISIYPLIRSITLSLYNYNLLKPDRINFTGLGNYVNAFTDSNFWNALKRTAYFTVFGVSIELILGMLIALLMNRDFRGKGIVRSLMIVPMILSPVAVGLVWRILYDYDAGMVNYFLSFLGVSKHAWLGDQTTALLSLIATDIWQWTSFCFLVCLAGLENIPQEPFEAARIDGASRLQSFRYLTLPFMKPVLTVVFTLRIIDSVKMFDLVFIMTNGGPGRSTETMNFFIYQTAFKFFHIGRASSYAVILTVLMSFTVSLLIKSLKKGGSDIV
ncbi:carbohydrate ABC transporter permease [Mesotoga sp. H07.pep.5.3]|uniref:carbohydrate ABC transporter permease n=1 Tax=Mesotoga sp. H07.pep.5.3 TaxID=1421003 RepID=UPI000C17B500|nr:sugar ABC transporter permease [Mesotoga sp. H07.pep.5.3]